MRHIQSQQKLLEYIAALCIRYSKMKVLRALQKVEAFAAKISDFTKTINIFTLDRSKDSHASAGANRAYTPGISPQPRQDFQGLGILQVARPIETRTGGEQSRDRASLALTTTMEGPFRIFRSGNYYRNKPFLIPSDIGRKVTTGSSTGAWQPRDAAASLVVVSRAAGPRSRFPEDLG